MFTSPLPIDLSRYQFRFIDVRPIAAREDRAVEGLVAANVLQAVDPGQAQRGGVLSWNVNLFARDRVNGRATPLQIRVESPSIPHDDIATGTVVTFDRLLVNFGETGRMAPRFSYTNLRATGEHPITEGRGDIGEWYVLADELSISAEQVRPKLDKSTATEAARQAARAQAVDLEEHLPQRSSADGVPKWEIDCIISTPTGVEWDKITVDSPTEPQVSGPITVEGLVLRGGEVGQYPNVMRWVSLSASKVLAARPAGRGRRDRTESTEPTPEHQGEHATV